MSHSKIDLSDLSRKHKHSIQSMALVILLTVPFVLYAAAKADLTGAVVALLGLMALVMLGLVLLK